MLTSSTLLTLLCAGYVHAHGFFYAPIDSTQGLVRGFSKLNIQIDDLRNPVADNAPVCRGEPASTKTPIQLTNGQPYTVTLAFSIGAQHPGPCQMEILDANNLNAPGVIIGSDPNCARTGTTVYEHKGVTSTQQCPNQCIPNSRTNDMCLHKWTFTVQNADKITCGDNCVMRWVWKGTHRSPVEVFENCADVSIKGYSGSTSTPVASTPAGSGSNPDTDNSLPPSNPTSIPPQTTQEADDTVPQVSPQETSNETPQVLPQADNRIPSDNTGYTRRSHRKCIRHAHSAY